MGQRCRIFDRQLEVLLKMSKRKPGGIDRITRKRPLDERLEFGEAEQSDGTLPTVPDEAFSLWFDVRVAGTQEPRGVHAQQLIIACCHREGFAHARSNEFVGLGVKNYLVERIGVAIKNRRHYAVRRHGNGVTKNRVDLIARATQEPRKWSISRFLSPLAEQMKNKEKGVRRDRLAARRHELLDRLQEDRHRRCPIRPGGPDRFGREARPIRESVEKSV